MNFCRKCQSDYEKPGTCNCFADAQPAKQLGAPPPFIPGKLMLEFIRKKYEDDRAAIARGAVGSQSIGPRCHTCGKNPQLCGHPQPVPMNNGAATVTTAQPFANTHCVPFANVGVVAWSYTGGGNC